jgi:hypothetical protein
MALRIGGVSGSRADARRQVDPLRAMNEYYLPFVPNAARQTTYIQR